MKKSAISDFTYEDALIMDDLHNTGDTYKQIAERYQVNPLTLKRFLERHDLWKPAKQKQKKCTHEEMVKIYKAYLVGTPLKKIEKDTHISMTVILRLLDAVNLRTVEGERLRAKVVEDLGLPKINVRSYKAVREERELQAELKTKVLNDCAVLKHKKRIRPFPCPFKKCSARKECSDINHPQDCASWRCWFTEDGDLKESRQETRDAILGKD